jgi:hypothetical protein
LGIAPIVSRLGGFQEKIRGDVKGETYQPPRLARILKTTIYTICHTNIKVISICHVIVGLFSYGQG